MVRGVWQSWGRCCVICSYLLLQSLINFNEISISFFPQSSTGATKIRYIAILYNNTAGRVHRMLKGNTNMARILKSFTEYHAVGHLQLLIFLLYFSCRTYHAYTTYLSMSTSASTSTPASACSSSSNGKFLFLLLSLLMLRHGLSPSQQFRPFGYCYGP